MEIGILATVIGALALGITKVWDKIFPDKPVYYEESRAIVEMQHMALEDCNEDRERLAKKLAECKEKLQTT